MSVTAKIDSSPRLRDGILVRPDAETGKGRVVGDPHRRRYFRFDELEGFIIECLDGERTAVDIQIEAAIQLGVELSLDEIQEFIDDLRDRELVEDGGLCLPALEPALGQQVYAALEQGGFQFRDADAPLPPGIVPSRRSPAEARLFDQAVALMREGRFSAALRCFEEILSANPGNQRAAAIRAVLVQAGSVRSESKRNESAKGNSNPLYLRIPFFNPDRVFTKLEPAFRFVWTRAFAVAYLALVTLAAGIALTHRTEILAHLPDLSAAGWAGGLLVAAVFLTAMHEMAHGLTCKHFGGKVPETGFLLLLFFMPALYVDVSDAWLFPRRSQRGLVSAAGPLFDLAAACCALILWWIVPPGPFHVACALSMTASLASVAMNLNPLMRLDGYYIMSDLSGVPNLRSVAISSLGRLLPGKGRESGVSLTPRARIFVGIYGVLSTVYILGVLMVLFRLVLGLSTNMAGLWGPVILVGILGYLARKPLRLLFVVLKRKLAAISLRGGMTLAASTLALVAILLIPWNLKIAGPVSVTSRNRVAVRPEVAGNLSEILVREGDAVDAGQVVARFNRSELLSQLAMTRSDIARGRAELELLLKGPEREHIRQAKEKVRSADVEASHLRARFERLSRLRNEGLVATDLYEQVGKELAIGEGSLRAAKDQERLLEKGARPERISAARADVARLETKAADVLRRLAACELRAPIRGIVVTPNLAEHNGERIPSGAALMEIANTDELVTEVSVVEAEIGDVAREQQVSIRFAAYPDRSFEGKVLEIAPMAEEDRLGRATFRVKCSIADSEGVLRPGMTGAAKIECGTQSIGRLVLRRVLRLIDPALL